MEAQGRQAGAVLQAGCGAFLTLSELPTLSILSFCHADSPQTLTKEEAAGPPGPQVLPATSLRVRGCAKGDPWHLGGGGLGCGAGTPTEAPPTHPQAIASREELHAQCARSLQDKDSLRKRVRELSEKADELQLQLFQREGQLLAAEGRLKRQQLEALALVRPPGPGLATAVCWPWRVPSLLGVGCGVQYSSGPGRLLWVRRRVRGSFWAGARQGRWPGTSSPHPGQLGPPPNLLTSPSSVATDLRPGGQFTQELPGGKCDPHPRGSWPQPLQTTVPRVSPEGPEARAPTSSGELNRPLKGRAADATT